MKKTSLLLFIAALMLSSCGTAAQWGASDNSQRFQDGIYSNSPSFRSKEEKVQSKSETDALIAKTKESPIYLFGDRKDTIMIPDNFSARIQYDQKVGGTIVTVGENPYDWRWDLENRYGYYYGPYSLGSSWYWSRHYSPYYSPYYSYYSPYYSYYNRYWGPWGYDPWYYGSCYGYYGFYDPWYYDPWYYGGYYGGYYGSYYAWHDPWHHYHHHHGWYDPHHGHGPSHIGGSHFEKRSYGLRAQTEGPRAMDRNSSKPALRTSGGTVRGGMSIGNTRSRSSSVANRTGGSVSRPATTSKATSGSSTSASKSSTMTRSTNYRRPASSQQSKSSSEYSGSSSTRSSSSSSSYSRSSSSSSSRSSSSYSRSSSSSSYSRSSSSSHSYGGSSSSSSYSRSSHSSGGSSSYSRGGSSGGYRR